MDTFCIQEILLFFLFPDTFRIQGSFIFCCFNTLSVLIKGCCSLFLCFQNFQISDVLLQRCITMSIVVFKNGQKLILLMRYVNNMYITCRKNQGILDNLSTTKLCFEKLIMQMSTASIPFLIALLASLSIAPDDVHVPKGLITLSKTYSKRVGNDFDTEYSN